ncbi:MAG TPA: NHL repeat-containing protein [Candidatus Kryptonia bacterium]
MRIFLKMDLIRSFLSTISDQFALLLAPALILFLTSFHELPSLVADYSFGNFRDPRGISIDAAGTVYVVDTGRDLLLRYDTKGDSTGGVGGYGWGDYQFDKPYDVCATNGVEIYVADYNNQRIQRFDRTLANVATLDTHDAADESDRFGYPSGVAVSRLGDLFICDDEDIRMVKVNTFSTVERTFGNYGEGAGALSMPGQVAIGSHDEIYVSDKGRIAVYDNFGNFVRSIGAGLLHNPTGIGVGNDKVGVCDSDTLYFFALGGELLARFSPADVVGENVAHFEDVSIEANKIYILTDRKVVVTRSNF